MSKSKTITKLNENGNSSNKNSQNIEFDFGNSELSEALIKAMTMTRKRLYPERYDKKGKLKVECLK